MFIWLILLTIVLVIGAITGVTVGLLFPDTLWLAACLAVSTAIAVMLMTGSKSIRDVMAFPKNQKAQCPMTEAPSEVESKQLEELSIKVVEPLA